MLEVNDHKLIIEFLEKCKADIIEDHVSYGQKASGNFIKNLEVNETATGGQLIDGAGYAYYLEYGRRPTGAGVSGSELIDRIKQWFTDKNLTITKSFNPYSVTAKIHKEGTLLYRIFSRTGSGSGVITRTVNDNNISEFIEKLSIFYHKEVFGDVSKELTI